MSDVENALTYVSPGLTAGSGLKLYNFPQDLQLLSVSPGLTAGSGLKPWKSRFSSKSKLVSPGLTAGSGLKHETYYAAVSIDGRVYSVRIAVDRIKNEVRGRGYYYHQVEEVSLGDEVGSTRVLSDSTSQAITPSSPNGKITLGQLSGKVNNDASKVVDENGEPLVVYHGSTRGGIINATSQHSFFTSDRIVARTYSEDDYEGSGGDNPTVQEMFLNIQNPLETDAQGNQWMNIPYDGRNYTTDDLASRARKNRNDGLILRNLEDNVGDEELPPSDVFVTLGGKAQIKSYLPA